MHLSKEPSVTNLPISITKLFPVFLNALVRNWYGHWGEERRNVPPSAPVLPLWPGPAVHMGLRKGALLINTGSLAEQALNTVLFLSVHTDQLNTSGEDPFLENFKISSCKSIDTA